MPTINMFACVVFLMVTWVDPQVPNHGIHTGYILEENIVSLGRFSPSKANSTERNYPKATKYLTGRIVPDGKMWISSL